MNTSHQSKRVPHTRQPVSQRRLFLEGLERRAVLAGDVWAASVAGNLIVHGDADDNGIHLQTMADGSVEVSGIEAGGSPTTINGSSEPFVAGEVRFLTRVHLGDGDDMLTIDHGAAAETDLNADVSANVNVNANADVAASAGIAGRLSGLLNGAGRGLLGNHHAREMLLIHTGGGEDSVEATVDADVDVRVLGNVSGDHLSIETMAEVDADANAHADADAGTALNAGSSAAAELPTAVSGATLDSDVDANVDAIFAPNVAANVGANHDLAVNLDLDANAVQLPWPVYHDSLRGAADLDANVNAAFDAAGQSTAGATGVNTDLDTALVASLAANPALNSASNLGTSSLLNNADLNLNGSIGGSAALNLTGDSAFDEIGQFNAGSSANIDANIAAQLALANASNFGLTANAVDDFFANTAAQQQLNANVNAGLLANLGNYDLNANGSLNTNVNFSNAFNPRIGVPMG